MPEPEASAVAELLAAANCPGDFRLTPLSGGANNRVYCVDVGVRRGLLKWYFHHPDDPRDRLHAEYSFATFAWQNGIRTGPQPLACDRHHRLGLYEFIQGNQLQPGKIASEHVAAAARFIGELNRNNQRRQAAQLPAASEACFSIAEHLACIDCRVDALRRIEDSCQVHQQALRFVEDQLAPAWQDVIATIRSSRDHKLERQLDRSDRILSPSDFGFHNAIVTSDGTLRFFDFEYAGWDDPAKLVCDFFCQVQVPVPDEFFPQFADAVTAELADSQRHRRRIDHLLPAYRIKWSCIVLNEFLPTAQTRRSFSHADADALTRKKHQLEKARGILRQLVK